MGLGATLITFVPNTIIKSGDVNSNTSALNGAANPAFTTVTASGLIRAASYRSASGEGMVITDDTVNGRITLSPTASSRGYAIQGKNPSSILTTGLIISSTGVVTLPTAVTAQAGIVVSGGGLAVTGGQTTLDNGAIGTNGSGTVSAVGFLLASGTQETSYCGGSFQAGGGGLTVIYPTSFQNRMTNVPSSITLVANGGSTLNATSPSAGNITAYGFLFAFLSSAAGVSRWLGTYTTVGNCLYAVHGADQMVDWHCDACDAVHTAFPLASVAQAPNVASGMTVPGEYGLSLTCPACGAIECLNTGMTSADETVLDPTDDRVTSRWQQASLIRQLQQALSLPVNA